MHCFTEENYTEGIVLPYNTKRLEEKTTPWFLPYSARPAGRLRTNGQ